VFFLSLIFLGVICVVAQTKTFVVDILPDTISIGDPQKVVSSHPSWWPPPKSTYFETTFNLPFYPQKGEIEMEVLNVNLLENYVYINGQRVGHLYTDASMNFVLYTITVPGWLLKPGKNSIRIESQKGLDGNYDDFLIRKIRLIAIRAEEPDMIKAELGESPFSSKNAGELVNLPSLPSLVQVSEGEEFQLSLISSSVEGYRWKLDESSFNRQAIKYISEENPLPCDTQGHIRQVFNFLAINPGESRIRFVKFFEKEGTISYVETQECKVLISKIIVLTGKVERMLFPSEELGTHQLVDENGDLICYLKTGSSSINLDNYNGLNVKVMGPSCSSYGEGVDLTLTVTKISLLKE